MNKEDRIKYLSGLRDKGTSCGSMEIVYKNKSKKFDVYEIDLDSLIYNRHNGRIASLVKSYEKQTGIILDPTKDDDRKKIEEFLEESNKPSNRATEENIEKHGQLKYGIVTKDGVIIDGNRRAMILKWDFAKKGQTPMYFKAAILNEELEDNPKEIMRLETIYQMGEDAKVDYNAIEKYLKCRDLKENGFDEEQIGGMMGEKEGKIKEYLSIMELMDEYLKSLGYAGIYTRLDKTEGMFVDVNKYLERYKKGKSVVVEWPYGSSDVNDLKLIYFDYIRWMYNRDRNRKEARDIENDSDSKGYRSIGKSRDSFFTNKDIWQQFRDSHFARIEPITKKESSIADIRARNPGQPLDELLKERDSVWAGQVSPVIKENMGRARNALDNKKNMDEPLKLLIKAKDSLDAINTESGAFLNDKDVFELVDTIRKLSDQHKRKIEKHRKGH